MCAFVKFDKVGKVYHSGDVNVTALKDVSFEIEKGEICVIVVAIDIDYIPCGIVVVLIFIFDSICFSSTSKTPMHWKIDDTETGVLAIIGRMVGIPIQ